MDDTDTQIQRDIDEYLERGDRINAASLVASLIFLVIGGIAFYTFLDIHGKTMTAAAIGLSMNIAFFAAILMLLLKTSVRQVQILTVVDKLRANERDQA